MLVNQDTYTCEAKYKKPEDVEPRHWRLRVNTDSSVSDTCSCFVCAFYETAFWIRHSLYTVWNCHFVLLFKMSVHLYAECFHKNSQYICTVCTISVVIIVILSYGIILSQKLEWNGPWILSWCLQDSAAPVGRTVDIYLYLHVFVCRGKALLPSLSSVTSFSRPFLLSCWLNCCPKNFFPW